MRGFEGDGTVIASASLQVYDCRGGTFELALTARSDVVVTVARNGRAFERFALRRDRSRVLTVPLDVPRGPGPRICSVELGGDRPFGTTRIEFRSP